MSPRPPLKDQLFNRDKVSYLAGLIGASWDGFDAAAFQRDVCARLDNLELKERINWIAEVLARNLPDDFAAACAIIAAALPPPLDGTVDDGEFGDFIFAPLGAFVARHGLDHADQAFDILEELTQRFSMEWAIRPFLDRWPEAAMARLEGWAVHPSCHVRRLVSEGTRPRLPWGARTSWPPDAALALLDRLYRDRTQYVRRSVANHLNDIAKTDPDLVLARLTRWRDGGEPADAEFDWLCAHALRTLAKAGDARALGFLGYDPDAPLCLERFDLARDQLRIGEMLEFSLTLTADAPCKVIVDYLIWFTKKNGRQAAKTFRVTSCEIRPDAPLCLTKRYRLRGNATTFTLYPGAHRIALQVNGRILGERGFELRA